jgi:hypothetical protein
MNTKTAAALEEIETIINAAASDRSVSRAEYRELLEEVMGFCEGAIDGLDGDDERDAVGADAAAAAEEEAEEDEVAAEGDVKADD